MRKKMQRFLAALGLTPADVTDAELEVVSKALAAVGDTDEAVENLAKSFADALVERLEKSPRKLAALLRHLDDDEDDEDEDEVDDDEEDEEEEEPADDDDDIDADLADALGGEEEAKEKTDEDAAFLRRQRAKIRKSLSAAMRTAVLPGVDPEELTETLVKSVGGVVDAHNNALRQEIGELRGLVSQQAGVIETMQKSLDRLTGQPARTPSPRLTLLRHHLEGGAGTGHPVSKDQVVEVTLEAMSKGLADVMEVTNMQKAAGTDRWPLFAERYTELVQSLAPKGSEAAV